MNRRLYRSSSDIMLGGVCSGLGAYLNIDPILVRVFFVLLALTNGLGVFIYLVLWIIVPREDRLPTDGGMVSSPSEIGDRARQVGEELHDVVRQSNPRLPQYIGIGLIILGGFALLHALPFTWLHWVSDAFFWPGLLILAGLVLVLRAARGE
ncbi:MAG TPA: PspC domain-containing protein [Longilinea sp.]|nr:PspC domain-containing protein [Longilinea sp.]